MAQVEQMLSSENLKPVGGEPDVSWDDSADIAMASWRSRTLDSLALIYIKHLRAL